MTQLVTRVSTELAADIDDAVSAGLANSRSDLVRIAIVELLARRKHEEVIRLTREAYLRQPATDEELATADANGREMIAEEPW